MTPEAGRRYLDKARQSLAHARAILAIAKGAALLVADDTGGTIWRISYKGPPAEHTGAPEGKTEPGTQAVGR